MKAGSESPQYVSPANIEELLSGLDHLPGDNLRGFFGGKRLRGVDLLLHYAGGELNVQGCPSMSLT